MNLVISVVNPFSSDVSLNKVIKFVKLYSPLKIKKSDLIFLEDNCINVYRNK
jgi:hypothetical protein